MDKKTKIKTIGVIAISVLFMALVVIAFIQGTQVSSSPFTYASISIHPLGYGMTVSNQELEQAHELKATVVPTITTTTTTTSTIQPTTTIPQKAN